MYPKWYDYRTHMLISGASSMRKTGLLRDAQRDRIVTGDGFLAFIHDKHHWEDLNGYLAYIDPLQPIIRLNISECPSVIPTNFFSYPATDIGSHSARLAGAVAGAGQMLQSMEEKRNIETVFQTAIAWCAETGLSLHAARQWLRPGNPEAVLEAASLVKNPETFTDMMQIADAGKQHGTWRNLVGSSWSRLRIFGNSLPLTLFTCGEGTLCPQAAVDHKAIILVHVTPHERFTPEAAAMYVSLILSQFLYVKGRYFIDIDEAPFVVNFDVVRMLDLMAKNGIRLTLVCHHPDQFDERLRVSLNANAQIRAVFGGLPHHERERMVPDFHAKALHERWIKEVIYSYQNVEYMLEDYTTESEGPFGPSIAESSRYVGRILPVRSGVIESSHQEKLSQLAETFVSDKGEYALKLPDWTGKCSLPHLTDYGVKDCTSAADKVFRLLSRQQALEFNNKHPQGSPPEEVYEQIKNKTPEVKIYAAVPYDPKIHKPRGKKKTV